MRKIMDRSLLNAAIASVAALALAGCSGGTAESESKMTSYSSSEAKADTATFFTLPQEQMGHVQIVAVEKSKLPRRLHLTGNVTYNAFKTTPVFSPIGGPVHEILVAPGETVLAGQPLLTVNSPDYSAARSAYLKARDAFFLADKIYTRSQDLYVHGAIAEADLQAAESGRTQAQADVQSSEDMLRALGIKDPEAMIKNPPKTTLQVPVPAPVAGEVVERLVGPGQLLQAAATQVFTISDMSTVWVLVNVYQNDVAFVHVGDAVDITTDAYPEVFHGRISFIAAALDPNTRTLLTEVDVPNPEDALRPGMYLQVKFVFSRVTPSIRIPAAAIVVRNGPRMVAVLDAQHAVHYRDVQLGRDFGNEIEVLTGLSAGDTLVVHPGDDIPEGTVVEPVPLSK